MTLLRPVSCGTCGRPLLWARTVNNKPIPLDQAPDPEGNQAVYRDGTGGWRTRQLRQGEEPFGYERRYMPHAATCGSPEAVVVPIRPLPANVIPISAARSRRDGPKRR